MGCLVAGGPGPSPLGTGEVAAHFPPGVFGNGVHHPGKNRERLCLHRSPVPRGADPQAAFDLVIEIADRDLRHTQPSYRDVAGTAGNDSIRFVEN